MIKWGLFDTTTKGIKNYSIKRENRILKENRMPQKELYSIKDIAEMRRRKSYIDVFVGSIVATITLIISLIFININ
ncbi:hypothetical protein [Mycoplasma procyoni]|uniref:hypothetical protein n=1 Tax=Mycoplasma procyoni TaxID=568784 RepID=UPI00197B389B|nr:hypothetical protein [Mycoplasma procyoni]MBN3535095.1 hypothetical protein [Mycoplasma procyoni]